MLDDGWFGARRNDRAGLGDWVVSADVWPDGLHPLVDPVRAQGMQFGLWFEPEMVNLDSDLARAHPEWIMAARDQLPVEPRTQHVLNLAIPEATSTSRGRSSRSSTSTRSTTSSGTTTATSSRPATQPDGGRPGRARADAGLLPAAAELRDAHPNLEIESCSSGGGRVDLGVLELTDRVWVSDNSDPLDRQRCCAGPLSWSRRSCWAPTSPRPAHTPPAADTTSSFRAATAIFGHLGVEWDLGAATPAERAVLARWIELLKEHRALLLGGDVVQMDAPDSRLNCTASSRTTDRRRCTRPPCSTRRTPTRRHG